VSRDMAILTPGARPAHGGVAETVPSQDCLLRIIRDRVEPNASPVKSTMAPEAEVNSEH